MNPKEQKTHTHRVQALEQRVQECEDAIREMLAALHDHREQHGAAIGYEMAARMDATKGLREQIFRLESEASSRHRELSSLLKIGTKSVLFGAHCFFLHPFFVAWAWWRLFGFPWDPRLWVLFFVHDLGYLGKPNMDGPEGERHVELGASIMSMLFDRWELASGVHAAYVTPDNRPLRLGRWGLLSLLHSRFYAKRLGLKPSRLCLADKLAICLTPAWLYLPMARATGELREYMQRSEQKEGQKYASMQTYSSDERQWFENMRAYVGRWVEAHKDGRDDSWTPEQGAREAVDSSGVLR